MFQGLVPCGGCTAAIQLLRAGGEAQFPTGWWFEFWMFFFIIFPAIWNFMIQPGYPWNYPLVGGDWNHGIYFMTIP
jgi:hypothetical protein